MFCILFERDLRILPVADNIPAIKCYAVCFRRFLILFARCWCLLHFSFQVLFPANFAFLQHPCLSNTQGVYKTMVRFQKLTRNLFLNLHGQNVHGLEKTHHAWCVFSKPCTKLTLHCNHRSGHLKTKHTESLFLLRRHLGNWPRGPALSMRSELLVVHEKLEQLPLLTVYVVPV